MEYAYEREWEEEGKGEGKKREEIKGKKEEQKWDG